MIRRIFAGIRSNVGMVSPIEVDMAMCQRDSLVDAEIKSLCRVTLLRTLRFAKGGSLGSP